MSGHRAGAIVLAGIDGTRTSMRAGAYAVGLARRQRSCLVLAHVASRPNLAIEPSFVASGVTANDEAVADLWHEVGTEVDLASMEVEYVTGQGEVAAELARIACDLGAAAVVVGASEQLRHRWIGSVGARLVARRLWPVVVVP
ncbi:MAG TPA: universal stress protein [Mycobacteriales bacterium]|nr:universal stress protein [Mycobacteriales bacterium]